MINKNLKKIVFEFITNSKTPIEQEILIEYIDYVEKICIDKGELKEILDDLIIEKKIRKVKDGFIKL